MAPERPLELIEPLGRGEQARTPPAIWAAAIPFRIERRVPCDDPFVGRALKHAEDKVEKGHLNY